MDTGGTLRFLLFFLSVIIGLGCSKGSDERKERLVFEDHFDRADVGPDWLDTGGNYKIVNGELRVKGARNKPLWLKKKLPRNAKVSFTARSMSPAVDIKVELWGDGKSKADALSYDATSYVVILGGWNNTRSIIARMDEHGDDRKVKKEPKGVVGKRYKFVISRQKRRFTWFLNGEVFLKMNDPEPLEGPGHEYFAFNNWMSEVFFDDVLVHEI
jgi:hypothetical protein